MKLQISAWLVACSVLASICTIASAETAPTPAKKPVAKKKAAPAKKKAAEAAPAAVSGDEDDNEPDVGSSTSTDYSCELGHKLTIYTNPEDDKHIALRWNKRLHRLTRVDTTTGANRFENKKFGLVWLGIPAKGILLDSKKGQQLANECKNAEQLAPKSQVSEPSAGKSGVKS